ncbi:hypothetical protein MBLNU230_g2185t1 [Neophaeotheca triangularis]
MDDPHAAAVARTEAYLKEKLDTLRRRDNIRDFVQGIKDSECWPYPEGQHGHVKAALTLDTSGYEQVAIKPLLHMFLRKIKLEYILLEVVTISTDEAAQKLVNLTMKLAPEHGPNYCQEDVEELAGAKDRTKVNAILTPSDLRILRSALSHRFQWVVDKVNSVNYLREKAYRKHLNCIGFVVSDDEDEMASTRELDDSGSESEPNEYQSKDDEVSDDETGDQSTFGSDSELAEDNSRPPPKLRADTSVTLQAKSTTIDAALPNALAVKGAAGNKSHHESQATHKRKADSRLEEAKPSKRSRLTLLKKELDVCLEESSGLASAMSTGRYEDFYTVGEMFSAVGGALGTISKFIDEGVEAEPGVASVKDEQQVA